MLVGDFMFIKSFSGIPEEDVQIAINSVQVSWSGVASLWSTSTKSVGEAKRNLCYNYLVAWYLSDMFPTLSKGTFSTGGAPLKSKDIGGVSVAFKDRKIQPELEALTSNIYGIRALDMLTTCPDMFLIR